MPASNVTRTQWVNLLDALCFAGFEMCFGDGSVVSSAQTTAYRKRGFQTADGLEWIRYADTVISSLTAKTGYQIYDITSPNSFGFTISNSRQRSGAAIVHTNEPKDDQVGTLSAEGNISYNPAEVVTRSGVTAQACQDVIDYWYNNGFNVPESLWLDPPTSITKPPLVKPIRLNDFMQTVTPVYVSRK